MPAKAWGNAGAFEFQAWLIDSSGYPMGQLATPDSPVAGTTYGAYRAKSFVGLEQPTPSRNLASFFGGQTFLGQIDLGISDLGTGNVTLAMLEETLLQMVTGITLDETTVSGWVMGSANELQPNLPQMGIMGSTKIRDEDGTLSWVNLVLPNIQLRPPTIQISQGTGQNPNNSVLELVPSIATRTAAGRLFSATAMGLFTDKGISYYIRYGAPIAVTTHIKDATMASTGASFTLPYLPLSAVTAGPNSFTDEGLAETPTTVNTSTGAVAITAGGTAGDRILALTPTAFIPSP